MTLNTENFGIAKRDGNPLRDYLIVNKTQSKHYPSDPRETASRCAEMGEELLKLCPSGKCLAVVFSETAVGIGALAASVLGERCFLISTTREEFSDCYNCVTFQEAHSHAPLHKLRVRGDINPDELSHIFIIDDEFTTGNTVKALAEKILANCKIPISAHSFAASRESVSALENIGVRVYAKYIYDELPDQKFPEEFSADEPERLKDPDKIVELNSLYDIRLGVNCKRYFDESERLCEAALRELRDDISTAKSARIIGTEELCLPPILLGKMLAKKGIKTQVHGVTRSPILPADAENYPIKTRSVLPSLYDGERTVYLYNSEKCDVTIIMTDAPKICDEDVKRLCGACGGERVLLVSLRSREMRTSLKREDGALLLKDVTGKISPMSPAERAAKMREGVHYCELLPEEYAPSAEYIALYETGLAAWSRQTALAVRSVSEQIFRSKGNDVVIVSLARAGTPIGVLIKRYLKLAHGISAAHYSISIIRGRGIDRAAVEYILARHNAAKIQFVDGWTGKGAITRQLAEALADFPEIDPRPAVLADPAGVCEICGTREDVFIPCSCLNSVVSGLFSRTILRGDLIQDGDFHGAVYFDEFSPHDRTYEFIEAIEREFESLPEYISEECSKPTGEGLEETRKIAEEFGVPDITLVKPSIGEATRVLLRRTPEVILLRDPESPLTRHLAELAREKKVPVQKYPLENYHAVGIIKN